MLYTLYHDSFRYRFLSFLLSFELRAMIDAHDLAGTPSKFTAVCIMLDSPRNDRCMYINLNPNAILFCKISCDLKITAQRLCHLVQQRPDRFLNEFLELLGINQ